MRSLSLDFRERIVGAYQKQECSYRALAVRFAASRTVVGTLVRQHREQGTLRPQAHLRGRTHAIRGQPLERLSTNRAGKPDPHHHRRVHDPRPA